MYMFLPITKIVLPKSKVPNPSTKNMRRKYNAMHTIDNDSTFFSQLLYHVWDWDKDKVWEAFKIESITSRPTSESSSKEFNLSCKLNQT